MDGLLRLLDELDGDPDDEDGGDFEPTTGPSYADECEMEDPEPSLGWTHGVDQSHPRWHRQPPNTGQFASAVLDGEQEHDGREDDEREPDGDDEPEDGL